MKSIKTVIMVLSCTPALAFAQAGASASASAKAQADVTVPANYSASARGKIEAAFSAARAKSLPDEPMRRRMAEGQAKGASDAQIAAAVQRVEMRLEVAQSAMIKAGRTRPQASEVASGEQAMEQGMTEAQLQAFVRHAPADRSLTVALNVLAKLESQGKSVDNAIATVQSKLDASATDEALVSLAGGVDAAGTPAAANGQASGTAAAAANNGHTGAAGNAAAGATAGVAGAVKGAAGATAGATGAVKGVLPKKP